MRTSHIPSIAAAGAAMLVWSCSVSTSHDGSVVGAPRMAPLGERVAPLPYRDVLYVSDVLDSRVDIYPLSGNNPQPIGSITHAIDTPVGMAVDSAHDLLVADNRTRSLTSAQKHIPTFVWFFAPGSKSPSFAYIQDIFFPTDVKVGADGTTYVASFGDGFVTEFPPGSRTPSLHFQPPSGMAIALALDAKNNLYVSCTNSNAVFKFAPGSTQGTDLGLVLGGEPHGMAFDASGNLLVAVSAAPNNGSTIDAFRPGATKPFKQIGGTFQPFMIAFNAAKTRLYAADFGSGNHDGGVFEFAYPSGRLVTKYTNGGATAAYGVATNPAAP